MPLLDNFAPERAIGHVVRHEGFYDYRLVLSAPGAIEWDVNFADPHLFFACGGPLFAQDEIQVAEHPILVEQPCAKFRTSYRDSEASSARSVVPKGSHSRCQPSSSVSPSLGVSSLGSGSCRTAPLKSAPCRIALLRSAPLRSASCR